MDLIEVKDVWKIYNLGEVDVPVLRGVSVRVAKGEMVSLTGASGSGKSTLMHILGCLDHVTKGQYFLDGQEVSRLSPNQRAEMRNREIGFVFQAFNLLSRTSALENVTMPLEYRHNGMSRREGVQRAEELLERVGLKDRMQHYPSQLSGGQQQRVAIARALVNQPSILFADEPTGNLDSKTSAEVLEMFQRLNTEEKITILLVTHDPTVAHTAGRVINIRDGQIVDDSSGASASAEGAQSPC